MMNAEQKRKEKKKKKNLKTITNGKIEMKKKTKHFESLHTALIKRGAPQNCGYSWHIV